THHNTRGAASRVVGRSRRYARRNVVKRKSPREIASHEDCWHGTSVVRISDELRPTWVPGRMASTARFDASDPQETRWFVALLHHYRDGDIDPLALFR